MRNVLTVFIASPSDVDDERRRASAIVDELNKTLKRFDWSIDLLGWEDMPPSFGRPQAHINREVERSDLFIGLLWQRWGTPPAVDSKYSSGFEEEFSIAKDRRELTGAPEIWMFFKTVEPTQKDDAGPQLKKVIAFRESLIRAKTVLFKEFDSLDTWEKVLRSCLLQHVLKVVLPSPLQMTGRQNQVHRSLADKSTALADQYQAALRALEYSPQLNGVFLAAHAVREMMNELPKTMDLPTLPEQGRLGDQVSVLEQKWNDALGSTCHQNGNWRGEVDEKLHRLLEAFRNFFSWWRESRPARRDVAKEVFRKADPAGMPLPEPLEKSRAELWLELHGYFVRVAHKGPTTPSQFESKLGELEQMLLETFHRQPSTDFSAIDRILNEEGTRDA